MNLDEKKNKALLLNLRHTVWFITRWGFKDSVISGDWTQKERRLEERDWGTKTLL